MNPQDWRMKYFCMEGPSRILLHAALVIVAQVIAWANLTQFYVPIIWHH